MGTVSKSLDFVLWRISNNFLFFFRYNDSDDDYLEQKPDGENSNQRAQAASLLDTPQNVAAIEHKKGYMMRKCCYESNYKKSMFNLCLTLQLTSVLSLFHFFFFFWFFSSVRKAFMENVLLYIERFSIVFT